jgi:hypothetical protein
MMPSETICDHVVAACGEAYQQKYRQMDREQALLKGTGLLDVRLGKVVYSSGCEPRSSKAGQSLDRELWVGGSNSKD